jgi:hypothetical protein
MSDKKDSATILGIGAAACAVCCAGPILAFLAAIGIGAAAGFALFGLVGLVIASLAGVVLYRRRQRRRTTRSRAPETVTLDPPTVRAAR